MSNLKKTIQINPELFKIGGTNKTRKNKEKKDLTLTPIITPNNLKNKLLNRIKEHKTRENTHIKNNDKKNNDNKNNNNNKESANVNVNVNENKNNITDEFYGAIDYLSELSKKQKKDVEKERYQKALNNKTIKNNNNNNVSNQFTNANVFLELPPELQEYNSFIPEKNETAMKINYSTDNDVPYGCLKGGVKPSYRTWCQTKKNKNYPELASVSSIRPPTPPKKNTNLNDTYIPTTPKQLNTNTTIIPREQPLSREQKLQQIKNKLKKLQENELLNNNVEAIKIKTDINNLQPIARNEIVVNDFELPELDCEPESKINPSNTSTENFLENDDIEISKVLNNDDKIKKVIKKTTKRKFTLGKSNNRVSVLLKDKKTRKNIINAQRELKKTNINDVRKYLKKHGIIKAGTTAPTDVLRKMFESSMLAGDITNINKEVLLHNFINSEESK
jgi:hypothetical protein